ncbi:MAG: acyl-CoA dehydrogenase family protein [Chloroflexi bacterium]|nr:acyl-CoA dehydrogenase family protein [Chloroflexota bacterium]
MRFAFTEQEERFRVEVRQWLDGNLPQDWEEVGEEGDEGAELRQREMAKRLGERGWLAIGWPKEYGGAARPLMEQVIFKEEMSYRRAPGLNVQGPEMIGNTILVFGSEEQKKRFLPPMSRGEVAWCQGYSEPGAGSDLASLKTRAVEDGDDLVVNGQKIWTSQAHVADWVFVGVRTDPDAPKHKGISLLVMPVKSPGLTVRPIINMANRKGLNETFYDNVRVPKANVIGEINRGWYVMAGLLDFERSGISGFGGAQRNVEELCDYARKAVVGGGPLIENVIVRHKLAQLMIDVGVGRMLSYRVAWMQSRGQLPNREASQAKLFSSELSQRIARQGCEIMGMFGIVGPGSRWAALKGRYEQAYMSSVPATIAGGTSEIQRNIIATRGLGLPRN